MIPKTDGVSRPYLDDINVISPMPRWLEDETKLWTGVKWLDALIKEDRVVSEWHSFQNTDICGQRFDRPRTGMSVSQSLNTALLLPVCRRQQGYHKGFDRQSYEVYHGC